MKKKNALYRDCLIVLLLGMLGFAGNAESKIIVIGGLTHEHRVQPGDVIAGTIRIRNTGGQTEEVKLYQTDYFFQSDGTNAYGEPGSSERSNAPWIVFSPSQMTVPPGEDMNVEYRIHVPEGDTLRGTYWSMMMVEAIPGSAYDVERMSRGVGINMIMRYGIQMVTHFGESGQRMIQFLDAAIQNEGEDFQLHVDIRNTGERWLRPDVWVEMYDLEGNLIGNFKGQKLRTYPGTSVRQRFDLTDVSVGTYKALVVADCGDEDLFGIQYNLKIEE